uniref:Exonuclease domain-containing protein n=1 Tax=Magallana gigas TaxID=29159 RepID=A0A8W8IGW8_MAGGI
MAKINSRKVDKRRDKNGRFVGQTQTCDLNNNNTKDLSEVHALHDHSYSSKKTPHMECVSLSAAPVLEIPPNDCNHSVISSSEKDTTHPKRHGRITTKSDTDTEDEQYFHDDIHEIPPPSSSPTISTLADGNNTFICFDLETTGLGLPSITQIAASSGERQFNQYVLPDEEISHSASATTGISFDGIALYKEGEKLDAVPLPEALARFSTWIKEFNSPVLDLLTVYPYLKIYYQARKAIPSHHWFTIQVCLIMLIMH